MTRVLLALEHRIERWALAKALTEFDVVGEAATVDETIRAIPALTPDVLVIDPTMPDHCGFDVLAQIRQLDAAPLLVVLAPFAEPTYAMRAIAAGAHAYVGKNEPPERLIEAIHAVTRGERVMPAAAEQQLAAGEELPGGALTAREFQVMEMLARGFTNREIAHHLEIRVKTVDTHRGHILKKLQLRNNSELTRFAVKHGYVTL